VSPVYTIFQGGHINVTKIRKYQDLRSAINIFCEILSIDRKLISGFKVDNISAHARLRTQRINLRKLRYTPSMKELYLDLKVHYNPERFPCVHLKFPDGGCAGVFKNGQLTFVGAKTSRYLYFMANVVEYIIATSPAY
jgi:TATA-box binding protein (TBP) (component of TFIID and TFIIIB)